jgi:hypothetical protein
MTGPHQRRLTALTADLPASLNPPHAELIANSEGRWILVR